MSNHFCTTHMVFVRGEKTKTKKRKSKIYEDVTTMVVVVLKKKQGMVK